MATIPPPSPFVLLQNLIDQAGDRLRPPAWAIHEIQYRSVLFLNHVLQQEPEAQQRLARHRGRAIEVRWRDLRICLAPTSAGLFELAGESTVPELTLTIEQTSPLKLARDRLRGEKSDIQITGDVQLAAEVNWLVDHLRWDAEDDLARLVGDVPAHAIGSTARKVAEMLRQFIGNPVQ